MKRLLRQRLITAVYYMTHPVTRPLPCLWTATFGVGIEILFSFSCSVFSSSCWLLWRWLHPLLRSKVMWVLTRNKLYLSDLMTTWDSHPEMTCVVYVGQLNKSNSSVNSAAHLRMKVRSLLGYVCGKSMEVSFSFEGHVNSLSVNEYLCNSKLPI